MYGCLEVLEDDFGKLSVPFAGSKSEFAWNDWKQNQKMSTGKWWESGSLGFN